MGGKKKSLTKTDTAILLLSIAFGLYFVVLMSIFLIVLWSSYAVNAVLLIFFFGTNEKLEEYLQAYELHYQIIRIIVYISFIVSIAYIAFTITYAYKDKMKLPSIIIGSILYAFLLFFIIKTFNRRVVVLFLIPFVLLTMCFVFTIKKSIRLKRNNAEKLDLMMENVR